MAQFPEELTTQAIELPEVLIQRGSVNIALPPAVGLAHQRAVDIVEQLLVGIDPELVDPEIRAMHQDIEDAITRGELPLPFDSSVDASIQARQYAAYVINAVTTWSAREAILTLSREHREAREQGIIGDNRTSEVLSQFLPPEVPKNEAALQLALVKNNHNLAYATILHDKGELSDEAYAQFVAIDAATEPSLPAYATGEIQVISAVEKVAPGLGSTTLRIVENVPDTGEVAVAS